MTPLPKLYDIGALPVLQPILVANPAYTASLKPPEPFDISGWQECDTECAKNYWLCKFYPPGDAPMVEFAAWPGKPLDTVALRAYIDSIPGMITFNGVGYDNPMIAAALQGFDCQTLKNLNDAIIVKGVKPWDFYRDFAIPEPDWQMIDIMEVAPGVRISLKMYAGRMHSAKMQDLPFDPDAEFTPLDRLMTSTYCGNDLRVTRELKTTIMDRLRLRHEIGQQYGIQVMSKSDAQIAEAVFKAKLPCKPSKTWLSHGHSFKYVAPDWITFVSPELQRVLAMVQSVDYIVKNPDELKVAEDEKVYDLDGKEIKSGIAMPKEIKGLDITIGQNVYRMGIGGLHSKEKKVHYKAKPGCWTLQDIDVKAYYPSMMLLMGLYPAGTGPAFVEIFRGIYNDRLHAKDMKAKCEAGIKALKGVEGAREERMRLHQELGAWKTLDEGLKIVLNGTYGKLGSRYSFLFAPELMIRTTLSGQLALLMLIEMLEMTGVRCVSANTDGIVVITPAGLETMRDEVIRWWEVKTGLEMESTFYKAIYLANVNNYIAFKEDGSAKAKGWYGESGVVPKASPSGKSPGKDICNDALIAFLRDGTPIEQTIMACRDIRRFLVVKNAAGGAWADTSFTPAVKTATGTVNGYATGGRYLGKALRWYYGVGVTNCLRYGKNGNMVGSSTGAVPLMDLDGSFPDNVDYAFYIETTREMLKKIGVV